jgi:hypothetical protein
VGRKGKEWAGDAMSLVLGGDVDHIDVLDHVSSRDFMFETGLAAGFTSIFKLAGFAARGALKLGGATQRGAAETLEKSTELEFSKGTVGAIKRTLNEAAEATPEARIEKLGLVRVDVERLARSFKMRAAGRAAKSTDPKATKRIIGVLDDSIEERSAIAGAFKSDIDRLMTNKEIVPLNGAAKFRELLGDTGMVNFVDDKAKSALMHQGRNSANFPRVWPSKAIVNKKLTNAIDSDSGGKIASRLGDRFNKVVDDVYDGNKIGLNTRQMDDIIDDLGAIANDSSQEIGKRVSTVRKAFMEDRDLAVSDVLLHSDQFAPEMKRFLENVTDGGGNFLSEVKRAFAKHGQNTEKLLEFRKIFTNEETIATTADAFFNKGNVRNIRELKALLGEDSYAWGDLVTTWLWDLVTSPQITSPSTGVLDASALINKIASLGKDVATEILGARKLASLRNQAVQFSSIPTDDLVKRRVSQDHVRRFIIFLSQMGAGSSMYRHSAIAGMARMGGAKPLLQEVLTDKKAWVEFLNARNAYTANKKNKGAVLRMIDWLETTVGSRVGNDWKWYLTAPGKANLNLWKDTLRARELSNQESFD